MIPATAVMQLHGVAFCHLKSFGMATRLAAVPGQRPVHKHAYTGTWDVTPLRRRLCVRSCSRQHLYGPGLLHLVWREPALSSLQAPGGYSRAQMLPLVHRSPQSGLGTLD